VSLKNTAGKAVIATDGQNGGAAGRFEIQIGGRTVFSVDGNGNMTATGTKSAVVAAGEYGQRKLYAVESPQNWFEDFGTGQMVNGTATVSFDPTFAETVNLDAPYHIFLTPLADHPLYVAEKTATAFIVRAVGGATCNLAFDYRIVALRKGFEHVRLSSDECANG